MQPQILVIDDDPPIGSLLAVSLAKKGLQVTVAKSGKQGLWLLEQHNFVLVLLDLGLPDMPGWKSFGGSMTAGRPRRSLWRLAKGLALSKPWRWCDWVPADKFP